MSRLILNTGAAPSTPAASKTSLYADSADKKVKQIDENGIINVLTPRVAKENFILNGGFDVIQRQDRVTLTTYSNTSGRALSADRWGITNENASVQYTSVNNDTPETGLNSRFYGRFKKITSTGKMVITQVIEGIHCLPLRGRKVRFSCKMRFSVAASMTVRLGLLQLTSAGTLDAPPATFVSAFGAASTDPTFGTNVSLITPLIADGGSIVGSAVNCVLTSAWVRYSATFTVPTDCKNIIPVIFTNGQPVANDELNIAEAAVYDGEEIMDWNPRLYAQEVALCQRYYCKTFPVLTAPAQTGGAGGSIRMPVTIAGAVATSIVGRWDFPVEMRATPGTVTFYNPSAGNAFSRNITAGTDATATSAANTSARGLHWNCTGLAAWTVGQDVAVHASADAEM